MAKEELHCAEVALYRLSRLALPKKARDRLLSRQAHRPEVLSGPRADRSSPNRGSTTYPCSGCLVGSRIEDNAAAKKETWVQISGCPLLGKRVIVTDCNEEEGSEVFADDCDLQGHPGHPARLASGVCSDGNPPSIQVSTNDPTPSLGAELLMIEANRRRIT